MKDTEITLLEAKVLLAAKKKIANSLAMFRPTERQEAFFLAMQRDDILEMLLGGGNRSGKSVCAALSLASFILNQPIIFRDGSEHYMRPERWRAVPLKVWIVGYDWTHIGKTIFRLLFVKGLFKVIRDQKTGKWRGWNPLNPGEDKQFKNTKPSPPLIRMEDLEGGEDGISWENKKDHQIKACTLKHDGTRVEFFASTGSRPQGDPANVIWVDERIEDGKWYAELMVRLMDDQGRIMWTAWPDTEPSAETSALEDRAAEQLGKPDQWAFNIVLKGRDNPYTQSLHRERIMSTLDEDERAARDEGSMNKNRWRMYAEFDKYRHRLLTLNPDEDDKIAKAVRAAGGIPGDWTRYLILDPGTVNPGVLFVAIPPPELGDFIVPYGELDLKNTSAKPLAEAIAAKTKGTYFEDFIIDSHAARQTPMGFDGRIGENYEKEFEAVKLRCRRRGSRFSFGSDNVTTRIMGVQGTLNIRHDQTVRLRIHNCPVLVKQLEQYKKAKDPKGKPTDEPAKHQTIDIATCLEYFVSRQDCGYVRPLAAPVEDTSSRQAAMKHLNGLFGRIGTKETSRSVSCGAGSVS